MHDYQDVLVPLYARLPTCLLILHEQKANDRLSRSDNRAQGLASARKFPQMEENNITELHSRKGYIKGHLKGLDTRFFKSKGSDYQSHHSDSSLR